MNLIDNIRYNYLQSTHAVTRIITVNVAVFLLISLLQLAAFLLQINLGVDTIQSYLTLPANFTAFMYKPWSIVTYMFLHSGPLHLVFKMLWLYWMGNILQEYLGNKHVYTAYFLGGITGGFIFMLAYNIFPAFEAVRFDASAVGASAGVLSIVVAVATLLPNYQIQLMFIGVVKLKWMALVLLLLDLISIAQNNPGGHIAHLGGALFGFLYIKQIYNTTFIDRLVSVFKPKSKLKIHHKAGGKNAQPSEQEIDKILDKISKSGYDSLTKTEREILYKASK